MASKLWTPDGDVATHERGIQACSPQEMEIIAQMHRIAQKYNIMLGCPKCGNPFQGFNDENGKTWSITCGCREIKATTRGNVVIG